MSDPGKSERARQKKRYRFSLRWLILLTFTCSVVFAMAGWESHCARRQTRLLAELAQLDVIVSRRDPTGLALAARKLGVSDAWIREKFGDGWLWRPRVLVTWTATDEQVSELAGRIKQLGNVEELHVEQSPISSEGIAAMQTQLPNVAVLTRADLAQQAIQQPRQYFASALVYFLLTASAGALAVVFVFLWPLLRRQTKRRLSAGA